MKLVIIEGLDNTGKDTLCDYLKLLGHNVIYRHWTFPEGDTNEDKILYQQHSFDKEFGLFKRMESDTYFSRPGNMILWNRSHIGELVYGNLYRDYDPVPWISNLESAYNIKDANAYLILLYADSKFICDNDDGQSFTTDTQQKDKEIELFIKAFDNSLIKNKLKIKVNEGTKYKSKESIRDEVYKFIGY